MHINALALLVHIALFGLTNLTNEKGMDELAWYSGMCRSVFKHIQPTYRKGLASITKPRNKLLNNSTGAHQGGVGCVVTCQR